MEGIGCMTLKFYMDFVVERLSALYPVQECKAIAVRLLKECVQGYKGYEHLVEPGRELAEFSLLGGVPDAAGSVAPADGGSGVCVEGFLLAAVERLSTGEPLQYVLGYEWFCGHRFKVAPGILIPRPETEELVRRVLEKCPAKIPANVPAKVGIAGGGESPLRVLDMCTGSGCIAWSVAAAIPGAEVYGCDISPRALEIARGQVIFAAEPQEVFATGHQEPLAAEPQAVLAAGGQGAPHRAKVKFFECDLLAPDALERILRECGEEKFDIVVSNPPYVCEQERGQMCRNVLDFEPGLALFVPDDDPMRFYSRISQLSGRLLGPGGVLLFEINERFGRETVEVMEQAGFVDCRIFEDIFGKERMAEGKI